MINKFQIEVFKRASLCRNFELETFKKVKDKRRNLTPSPSFGSSPIRDAHSYGGNAIGAESPNSSFSTDLRTWIGDEDINNFLDSTSVHQKRYKNHHASLCEWF